MLIKKLVKNILGHALKSFALHLPKSGIDIILMYHRVLDKIPEGLYDPAMIVTSATLDIHIHEISKYFDIVPLEYVLSGNNTRNTCAITFDDGWRDNYLYAWPILKKYNVPATIFLPINNIENNNKFWFQEVWDLSSAAYHNKLDAEFIKYFSSVIHSWNPIKLGTTEICDLINELKRIPAENIDGIIRFAYKKFEVENKSNEDNLKLDEIRKMGRQGVLFGSHGLNHYILTSVGSATKKREVMESLQRLKEMNIHMSEIFSYPNGDWDTETVDNVKEAGYIGAVTTNIGYNNKDTNPYQLFRIAMHEEISNSASLFWYRIYQGIWKHSIIQVLNN